MNTTPTLLSPGQKKFSTPSRRPSEHHCNADRKQNPTIRLEETVLTSLSRNLFGSPPHNPPNRTHAPKCLR